MKCKHGTCVHLKDIPFGESPECPIAIQCQELQNKIDLMVSNCQNAIEKLKIIIDVYEPHHLEVMLSLANIIATSKKAIPTKDAIQFNNTQKV